MGHSSKPLQKQAAAALSFDNEVRHASTPATMACHAVAMLMAKWCLLCMVALSMHHHQNVANGLILRSTTASSHPRRTSRPSFMSATTTARPTTTSSGTSATATRLFLALQDLLEGGEDYPRRKANNYTGASSTAITSHTHTHKGPATAKVAGGRVNVRVRNIMQLILTSTAASSSSGDSLSNKDWAKTRNYLYNNPAITEPQVDAVLEFLHEIFPDHQSELVPKIVQSVPRIFRKNVETYLRPTTEFLQTFYGPDLFYEVCTVLNVWMCCLCV